MLIRTRMLSVPLGAQTRHLHPSRWELPMTCAHTTQRSAVPVKAQTMYPRRPPKTGTRMYVGPTQEEKGLVIRRQQNRGQNLHIQRWMLRAPEAPRWAVLSVHTRTRQVPRGAPGGKRTPGARGESVPRAKDKGQRRCPNGRHGRDYPVPLAAQASLQLLGAAHKVHILTWMPLVSLETRALHLHHHGPTKRPAHTPQVMRRCPHSR